MAFRIRNSPQQAQSRVPLVTVAALAERGFEIIRVDSGESAERFARRSSAAFLEHFHGHYTDSLTLDALLGFKAALADSGLSPKTQGHYLAQAKRLTLIGQELGLVAPYPLKRLSLPSVPIKVNQAKSPDQVGMMIHAAQLRIRDRHRAKSFANHLRLTYLGAFRLSETIRLVSNRGVWESENCFVPTEYDGVTTVGKTNKVYADQGFARRLIVTAEAKAVLEQTDPLWTPDEAGFAAFSVFGCFYCDWPPRLLRHSAATAMLEARGGDSACLNAVQLVLGHYHAAGFDRVALSYIQPLVTTCLSVLSILPALLEGATDRAKKTLVLESERPRMKRRGRPIIYKDSA